MKFYEIYEFMLKKAGFQAPAASTDFQRLQKILDFYKKNL